VKAVFDTKPNSGYDDDITRRYHFPRQYLPIATASASDWIVYREPQRNGGRRAYVATAHVDRIESDVSRPGHSYAFVSGYLPFDRPVPFVAAGRYAEEALRAIGNPSRVGASIQGRSIRELSEADFGRIVHAGLRQTLAPENAIRLDLVEDCVDQETLSLLSAAPEDQERRVVQMLVNKKIRAASFRRQVCDAYGDRCAVTGLRIVNGGGKAEVQAAHILPVSAGGPDTVQNGLALSATAHWLFDRHLISLTDDYGLLVSHNKVPAELRPLFAQQLERIHLPSDIRLWPHPAYVRRHREAFAST
jgi:putative restriction endonuclease